MSTALALLTPSPTGVLGTGPRGATPARDCTFEAGGQISPNGKWVSFLNGKWLHHLTLAFPGLSNPGLELSTFPHHRLRILRKRDSDTVRFSFKMFWSGPQAADPRA